jgi:hypothetical protein
MKLSTKPFFISAALLIPILTACHSLTISMNETNPPSFSFSASRFAECCTSLRSLVIYEIPSRYRHTPFEIPDSKDRIILWRISPRQGTDNTAEALPTITYGLVPPTFVQEVPANGTPPPLLEGRVYEVIGPGAKVPAPRIRFTIQHGQAIELPGSSHF